MRSLHRTRVRLVAAALVSGLGSGLALADAAPPPALQALPELGVSAYMGRWYQLALFPNRFQRQCVVDTTAEYEQRADGMVVVINRCRLADGRFDEAVGLARPVGRITGDRLAPAQFEVSFLPAWLRWLPLGWGRYWVIQMADDGRYAVVSEPTREYLWVLARTPKLSAADESAIRSRLVEQGLDLLRLQPHPQSGSVR